MSRLTRDGAAEPVWRDQIRARTRTGKFIKTPVIEELATVLGPCQRKVATTSTKSIPERAGGTVESKCEPSMTPWVPGSSIELSEIENRF